MDDRHSYGHHSLDLDDIEFGHTKDGEDYNSMDESERLALEEEHAPGPEIRDYVRKRLLGPDHEAGPINEIDENGQIGPEDDDFVADREIRP